VSKGKRIGLVCHSTLGGSGVVAVELGQALEARGHDVCVISHGRPPRIGDLTLHEVSSPTHALFPGGEQTLALATRLAELELDVIHVHYAIPHATSALLARQLGSKAKIVTTLHGTDVLTLGRDRALHAIVKHSVQQSDAVTAPTRYLCDEAQRTFGVSPEHIGNFVDTEHFKPGGAPGPVLVHHSNFRALKRVDDVVRIFAAVSQQVAGARLLLAGDGPMRPEIERQAKGLDVTFAGEQLDVAPLLQQARVFLFPSETESFGLAGLEALACGVPVIASRTGGLPELVTDGEDGFLRDVGDVAGMAEAARRLLQDDALHRRMSHAARQTAERHWRIGPKVELYEALYARLLNP
jgi:N-acetyl-alpha-D-glucosaminyl L-malate synthase BshA